MNEFAGLQEFTFADLAEAVERRQCKLTYKDERHTGVPLSVVNRVRGATTDKERRKILSEAINADGEHLDPDLQADYFERYCTAKVRGAAIKGSIRKSRPFKGSKIALARLAALPQTFTLSQVVGTPTKPPWSLLRAWEAAGRIEPTGRAGEWRKL